MDKPIFYLIKVHGHLDATLAGWFEGLTISNQDDGQAMLSGYLTDQAALHGALNRISSLGLILISVNGATEEETGK